MGYNMTIRYKTDLRNYTVLVCFNIEYLKEWKNGNMKASALIVESARFQANYPKEVKS